MAPMVSHLKEIGAIEATAYGQKECFEAGINFARVEGIVPAPEATHAVKGTIEAALECKKNGKGKTILFNLCGHGHFDMRAYGDYFDNKLEEDKYDEVGVNKALEELPKIA
jgi:tryptophan synthase beta chain